MNNEIKAQVWKDLLAISASTGFLCVVGLYNFFPLIFNHDTGIYIRSAFTGLVRFDRPLFYSLFIYFASLKTSLWLLVIVQALIVSLSVYYCFRYFITGPYYSYWYTGFMLLVSFCMGASFNASFLMPDVFAAVMIVCVGLLLFVKHFHIRDFIIIIVLTVLSILVHNSNAIICTVLFLILITGLIFRPVRSAYVAAGIQKMRIFLLIVLVIISNLISASIHYKYGGVFKSSRGGPVFVMGSLVTMGVVDTYLAENCNRKQYKICRYKDSIPTNFLWQMNSPVNLTGGWIANEKEYAAIIKDIITTPEHVRTIAFKSALFTLQQFFHFDMADARVPMSSVNEAIENNYPNEYRQYSQARQSRDELSFDIVNQLQTCAVAGCLFCYLLVFYYRKMNIRYRILIVFILAALVVNAWVCGTFSGVFPRYMNRVMWLLPLPLFLYVSGMVDLRQLLYVIKPGKCR